MVPIYPYLLHSVCHKKSRKLSYFPPVVVVVPDVLWLWLLRKRKNIPDYRDIIPVKIIACDTAKDVCPSNVYFL